MSVSFEETIRTITGFSPVKSRPLSGGCIAEVRLITLENNSRLVTKIGRAGDRLDLEGHMLEKLGQTKTVPVPSVLYAADHLLVMDYLETSGGITDSVQRDAAKKLAALHQVSQDFFGYEEDTVIGGLPQPNPKTTSWVDFFKTHRLLHMGKEALNAGRLSQRMYDRLENFSEKLSRLIEEPASPSLLHGDLWTGNVLCHNGTLAGLIDPAIYFGHAEIELAFTTMFNTFGKAFFDAYHQINPIAPGFFEDRLDIYNLYPLLVHVRLFGGSYVASVERVLTRHGC